MPFLIAKNQKVRYDESKPIDERTISMKKQNKILYLLLSIILIFSMTGCLSAQNQSSQDTLSATIAESGTYTSKEDVALYIHTYEKLPSNYITKSEAHKLGWKQKGTLDEVAPGKSIGGDYFGNYEGKLPRDNEYHECDIDYEKGNRNGKRLVYSDDGDIYYTEDHYSTFEQLYGDNK